MTTTVVCPRCEAKLKAPEQLQGKTVKCPRCQAAVAIPPALDEVEVLDDADAPVETPADEAATVVEVPTVAGAEPPIGPAKPAPAPERRRRFKKKPKGMLAMMGLPSIGIDERLILGVLVLAGVLVTGGCLVGGLYYLFRTPPPEDIPEEQWKPFEVAGRCKALMPGTWAKETRSEAGVTLTMYGCQPSKEAVFGVGYAETPLPPQRRTLPADTILEDTCNGAIERVRPQGAVVGQFES